MKYNNYYRKLNINLNLAPTEIDPTPSTVIGTHSLVERFYALNDAMQSVPRETMSGGTPRLEP